MTAQVVLAHVLIQVDELLEHAERRRAWADVVELRDLREHVRDVRMHLLRPRLPGEVLFYPIRNGLREETPFV